MSDPPAGRCDRAGSGRAGLPSSAALHALASRVTWPLWGGHVASPVFSPHLVTPHRTTRTAAHTKHHTAPHSHHTHTTSHRPHASRRTTANYTSLSRRAPTSHARVMRVGWLGCVVAFHPTGGLAHAPEVALPLATNSVRSQCDLLRPPVNLACARPVVGKRFLRSAPSSRQLVSLALIVPVRTVQHSFRSRGAFEPAPVRCRTHHCLEWATMRTRLPAPREPAAHTEGAARLVNEREVVTGYAHVSIR